MISALPRTPGEREAGGDRLRDRHQVGLDAEVLDREHLAGAAEAGLHLVDDRGRCRRRSQISRTPCDELARRDDEAALALHGLEDDRRDRLARDLRENARSSAASASSAVMPRYAFGNGTR